MYIFWGSSDITRPVNWPAGVDFPSQRRLVNVSFDSTQFERNRAGMNYSGIIYFDETSVQNQTRCIDIYNRQNDIDVYGLGKYYVRTVGNNLWERYQWRPSAQGSYVPDPNQDIQIISGRSAERANFEDNYSSRLSLLNTMQIVPSIDPVVLNLYIQQLAAILENHIRFENRRLRIDA